MSSKSESLRNLSPLAKRLRKTQSSKDYQKLDVWLSKKGLIQSPKHANNKQENDCSPLKLPETNKAGNTKKHSLNQSIDSPNTGHKDSIKEVKSKLSSRSTNSNTRKRNISREKNTKSSSQTLNKTESPENISIRSRLHKSKSPQLKKTSKSPIQNYKKVETNTISPKTASIKEKVIKTPKNLRSRNKTEDSKEKIAETVQKSSSGKTKPFKRYNSSDSCELPSFANMLNNKSKKNKKITTTKKEQKALFQKYGVHVPTVDEILRDKERLEKDKQKLAQFVPMNDDSLLFEPFIEEAPQEKENILHCKDLTNEQLLKSFKKNRKYLNSIISGKIKNERHDKYFDKNRVITNSFSDLTYNTSTIVFTFEQNEYLIDLLQEAFDPEDKKTQYFFQVLLPELCLKIFMEKHKMNYDVAVKHLDKQPILDN
ncbi:unnamed protein product [Psylliodes chrysocephalus]|uniref:Uncharacterized protein n=1 Tax=Psylliodes chrysocephalus TaxID=3402493 RepID=A0A9P0DCB5_9CUCU|nr:unnamed protein product [Psylliodes chrysocephala]